MINSYFDVGAFLAALDQVRQKRGANWYTVFRETGIFGVLTARQRQSWCGTTDGHTRAMSVHTMARLAMWADLDIRQFLKEEEVKV